MTSKEIIIRVLEFSGPERIGWDFNRPYPSDFRWVGATSPHKWEWGDYPELRKLVPDFNGQLRKDEFGNIWGRLEGLSKGEVVKGALEDGWDLLNTYKLPEFYTDMAYYEKAKDIVKDNKDKYIIGGLPGFPFAIMRYLRRMENFFIDIMLNESEVLRLNEMVVNMLAKMIDIYGEIGVDGIMFAEDWGTQESLLINPKTWRKLFKPSFEYIIGRAHERHMHVLMHSCGYIYEIIPDLIEVGVDALQLDQPELMGVERLADEFGGKVAFYCPVDIQKIMQTGDKKIIQDEARKMIQYFGKFNGGFIAKDYPQWDVINVQEEWAQWAREIFMGVY